MPVAGCLHFGSVGCEFVGEASSFFAIFVGVEASIQFVF